MKRFYFGCLVLILIAATLGELGRIPIATANGILPNDILVGLLGLTWLFDKTFLQREWPKFTLWAPFLVFVSIAFISLLNGSRGLTTNETLISGLYLVRFIEYSLLAFITFDLCQKRNKFQNWSKKTFYALLIAALVLVTLGFLQLKFFPDFTELQDDGWDPHINRLLSTWFDPNLLGGMLAFIISLAIGVSLDNKKDRKWILSIALILLVSLFLTYSRSAYLAAMAGIGLIGLLKSKKLIVIGLIAGLMLVTVSGRAQERVLDMMHSAQSLLNTESVELPDATARLRIESWKNAITIIEDHPWLGVGYNTYSYVQADYGFVKSLDNHAATGSDSTLLTIFATTGIIGFVAYLWFLGTLLLTTFINRKDGLSIGFFSGTCALLIHSIFVNSLLFTPLLVFFYIGTGLAMSRQKNSSSL